MTGKKKISAKESGDELKNQYGFQGNHREAYGYDPYLAYFPVDNDVFFAYEGKDPREAAMSAPEESKDQSKNVADAKKESASMVNKEASEAASDHKLKVTQEEGRPVVLEPEKEEKKDKDKNKPLTKHSEDKKKIEIKDKTKDPSTDSPKPTISENLNKKPDLKKIEPGETDQLPEKEDAKDADSSAEIGPQREPVFADFLDYLHSGMSEEEEKGAVNELRAGLVTHAQEEKQLIIQSSAEQKEILSASIQEKVDQVQQSMAEQSALITSIYDGISAQIEAVASKEKQKIESEFEKKKAEIEANTLKQVLSLETEISNRVKSFTDYAQEQKKMPHQYAEEEAKRADDELEQAIAKSYSIGNVEAGRHPGSDGNRPKQREAAQQVAKDSASDIRAKKAPLRQSLMDEANNFKGDYDQFISEVTQQLEETKKSLKPAIEQKGKTSLDKLEAMHKKSVDLLDNQLKIEKEKIAKGKASSLERLDKKGQGIISMIHKQGATGQENLAQMAQSILGQIDNSQSKYLQIIDAQAVPSFVAIKELVEAGSSEISEASTMGSESMKGTVRDIQGSFEQLTETFNGEAIKLVQECRTNGEGIKKAFDTSSKTVSDSFQKEALGITESTMREQGLIISDSMTGLDKFIQQRKDKLAEVNNQFKEKIKTKASESIEKSKLPLTDPLEDRVREASKKADASWWEGVLDALASIVVGLIIVIAIAAILIALGVSGTVLLVVGLVALAAFGIYEAYKRYQDGFSLGESILWGFGDVIGYTGVVEGYTGELIVPGGKPVVKLSSYERAKRATEGTINILLLLAPLKAKIPGIRRIPGLPSVFGGLKGMIPAALMEEGAILPRIFEAASKGGSKVSEVIADGMKLLEEQGARSRKFYKGVFEKLMGSGKPVPEGGVIPDVVPPVENVNPGNELPKKDPVIIDKEVKTPEVKTSEINKPEVKTPELTPKTDPPKPKVEPKKQPVHPTVSETGFGGYRATFRGDNKAFAMFEPEGSGVHVSDLFRGSQPKGSAGTMLAESLKGAGINKPTSIRFTNILDTQPTLKQLADKVPIGDTVLGKTLSSTVEELGGVVTEWKTGTTRGKQWIEAVIEYPEAPGKITNPIKSQEISDPEGLLKNDDAPVTERNPKPQNDKTRPLESQADPVKDVLGPGRISHPEEWNTMIKTMEDAGVEIRYTEPGKEALAYAPGLRAGEPGQIIIDPDASISALKHEYQHFLDDQAIGFGGMATLFDAPLRYEWEFKAYYEEIKMMRQQRRFDVARKLLENLRKEKALLETNIGPVKRVDTVKPTEPMKTVKPTDPVEPIKSEEPLMSVEPKEEPLKSMESVKSTDPVDPVKPIKTEEPKKSEESKGTPLKSISDWTELEKFLRSKLSSKIEPKVLDKLILNLQNSGEDGLVLANRIHNGTYDGVEGYMDLIKKASTDKHTLIAANQALSKADEALASGANISLFRFEHDLQTGVHDVDFGIKRPGGSGYEKGYQFKSLDGKLNSKKIQDACTQLKDVDADIKIVELNCPSTKPTEITDAKIIKEMKFQGTRNKITEFHFIFDDGSKVTIKTAELK